MATPESNPLDAASPLEPSQPLAVAAGSAVSQYYAWIDSNREKRFSTWEDEIAYMESLGFKLVPPVFKIANWSVRLMSPELTPKLFVSSPKGPREMDANLDRYAAELGYPLYYLPNTQSDTPKGRSPGGCV